MVFQFLCKMERKVNSWIRRSRLHYNINKLRNMLTICKVGMSNVVDILHDIAVLHAKSEDEWIAKNRRIKEVAATAGTRILIGHWKLLNIVKGIMKTRVGQRFLANHTEFREQLEEMLQNENIDHSEYSEYIFNQARTPFLVIHKPQFHMDPLPRVPQVE